MEYGGEEKPRMTKSSISSPCIRLWCLAAWCLALSTGLFATNAARAQGGDQIPPPWQAQDIGAPAAGYTLYTSTIWKGYNAPYEQPGYPYFGGTYKVTGGGSDIYNGSDQFHFVYQAISGDVTIIARISSQTDTSPWAKAGLMMRQSLSASSNFVDIVQTPETLGLQLQYRNAANPNCGSVQGGYLKVYWLKLQRVGGNVTAYSAPDNSGGNHLSQLPGTWTQLGTEPLATGTAYVGMCVTSHNTGSLCTAVFDNVANVDVTTSTSYNTLTSVQAVGANVFSDNMGINTHFSFNGPNGVWEQNYDDNKTTGAPGLKTYLSGLGIRHIRDSLWNAQQDPGYSSVNEELASRYGILTEVPCSVNPLGTNGTQSDLQSQYINNPILDSGVGTVVDAVEGPNEPDLSWPAATGKYPRPATTYNTVGFSASGGVAVMPSGPEQFLSDLYSGIKNTSTTQSLPVYNMPMGGSAHYASMTLEPFCDFGNFHPYPFSGNDGGWPLVYDTIPNYIQLGQQPSDNIDEFANAFDTYQPQTGTRPMVATESGYQTGTGAYTVSQLALAKYVPRIFTEYYRRGIKKTFLYALLDDGDDRNIANGSLNAGLISFHSVDGSGNAPYTLTLKPAYTALQSLIYLLADRGFTYTPGSLAYSLNVSPVYGYTEPISGQTIDYTRTWYVHSLLLQRHDGTFFLCLWHEVASSSWADVNGNKINGTARNITPPAMPTVVNLPGLSGSVTVYTYDQSTWRLQGVPTAISGGAVSVNVPDTVTVIEIPPAALPVAPGTYTLKPSCATGSRLDAYASGQTDGTKVEIWHADSQTNQQWVLASAGGGWYTIKPSYDSNLCLDVKSGGNTNGTLVQLWHIDNTSSQLWKPISNGNGTYKLTPMCAPGYMLDVSEAGQADGTQVDIYTDNGTGAQQWTFGSSITLSSSLNPSPVGSSITLTATVTGINPTGMIAFTDASAPLATVSTGNGVATVTLSTLTQGTHSLTAAYSGDVFNAPSTSSVLTQTVRLATVSGTVTLQGWTGAAPPLTFTLTPTGGTGGSIVTQTLTAGTGGVFTLSNIAAGTYTLGIKGSKWLQKDVAVNTTDGDVSGLSALLLAGDANNDNYVGASDFSLLRASYGKSSTQTGYDSRADFNGDGYVGASDFSLLRANYGKQGDR